MTDFPTLSYTSASDNPTFGCTWGLKKYPFREESPRIGHCRIEYSLPRPPPPFPTPRCPITSTCVRFPLSLALRLSVRKLSISAGIRERAPGDLDLLNVPIRPDTFKEFKECNYDRIAWMYVNLFKVQFAYKRFLTSTNAIASFHCYRSVNPYGTLSPSTPERRR